MRIERVALERPGKRHTEAFLTAVGRSAPLHRNLVTPIRTEKGFHRFVAHCRSPRCSNFFVVLADTRELVGVINTIFCQAADRIVDGQW